TQYSEDNNNQYPFTHVACDSQGNCFEIHVIAGSPNRLFYRPGTLIPAAPVQAEIPVQEESSGTGSAQIWATIR
ncbi:MAG: hypothetical protein QNJ51_24225, partial [Calothrix sp. MO_167.B12]|nr:hypothetical protein [Calothrix sp. MO_167.B12]